MHSSAAFSTFGVHDRHLCLVPRHSHHPEEPPCPPSRRSRPPAVPGSHSQATAGICISTWWVLDTIPPSPCVIFYLQIGIHTCRARQELMPSSQRHQEGGFGSCSAGEGWRQGVCPIPQPVPTGGTRAQSGPSGACALCARLGSVLSWVPSPAWCRRDALSERFLSRQGSESRLAATAAETPGQAASPLTGPWAPCLPLPLVLSRSPGGTGAGGGSSVNTCVGTFHGCLGAAEP